MKESDGWKMLYKVKNMKLMRSNEEDLQVAKGPKISTREEIDDA